jgi:hypothetical protein
MGFGGVGLVFAASDVRLEGPIEHGGSAVIKISDGRQEGTAVRRYQWRFTDLTDRKAIELSCERQP